MVQAPFPWFGGKRRIGRLIWERFGHVDNYVEPFFGSGAVLLGRPEHLCGGLETVNDLDGFVCNFWRALQSDPGAVTQYADQPVNENDLHARHAWLTEQRADLSARLEGDPAYYDARIAGWWVWGMSCWIGGGFCSGNGPWRRQDGRLVHCEDDGQGQGVSRKLVHLGDAGRGVSRNLVHLGDAGQGVSRSRVHLGNAGRGVSRNLVHLGDAGQVNGLRAWMLALAARLRYVRVCCGEWSRVCGPTPTIKQGLTAVLLDPPYGNDRRDQNIYTEDSMTVAAAVCQWARDHGEDSRLRIALCGYEGDYTLNGWSHVRWKAAGGYGNLGDGQGRVNAEREVVWFSPHCLSAQQGRLFADEDECGPS